MDDHYACAKSPQVLSCCECPYATNLKVDLTKHFNRNHDKKPFSAAVYYCLLCRFKSYSRLIFEHHKCVQCSKSTECINPTSEGKGAINLNQIGGARWVVCVSKPIDQPGKGDKLCKSVEYANRKSKHIEDSPLLHCDHCSYSTKNKDNLREHMWDVHSKSVRLFQCELCPYIAKQRPHLKNHFIWKHATDNLQWFHCESCSHKTKSKSALRQHILSIHQNPDKIQWFLCEYCSYKSKWRSGLARHQRYKHTGVEQIQWFYCDKCSYKAKAKSNLDQHLLGRKHADLRFAKWFQCEHCSYKSKLKHHFKKHMLSRHNSG